ncbi:hypothetical protein EJ08DRAFT_650258 [Tothia fuscella]|uniref:J domain-containing protein n=1 Tax=Tothia fuscella TaxID=1048955 RepID=A0A9P4TWS7_9PEZI|nr:hypothetical protein EJ08DRAFT_650258 [Tothia fuscella]
MLTKKPAIVLSSYTALNSQCAPPKSRTSCLYPPPRTRRTYATISDDKTTKQPSHSQPQTEDPDNWPSVKAPHTIPTPYAILGLKRGAPYTKTDKFYHLVKLYHPDRPSHQPLLSPTTRTERYRLIIAAHTLLSDPTKRNLYDLYGSGWLGTHPAAKSPSFTYNEIARKAAMQNATWEDWEKWYDKFRQPGDPPRAPQQTIYTSNTAFITVIAILAALGGIGQATRAEGSSARFIEQRDALHNEAARALQAERTRRQGLGKEERIEEFLRQRDPAAWADEGVRGLVLDPDICESGQASVAERDNDFRRRYK